MMRKARRVALVTGGTRRVGRAIVERLSKEGFEVCFTSRSNPSLGFRLAKKLRTSTCFIGGVDLTDPQAAVERVHSLFTASFDRLDVLVNNASIYSPGDEKLQEMFAIHVRSPLLLVRAFEPMLRKSKGHVINMLDLLAERPWPRYAAYCATKAALWSLTLSLARELAPQVMVNGIAPGVVDWPEDTPESEKRKYLKRVPLQRAGTPQDVANLVHFLTMEGGYITGQVIRLDGGRSIA